MEKVHKPSRSLQGDGGESGSKEAKRLGWRKGREGEKENFYNFIEGDFRAMLI